MSDKLYGIVKWFSNSVGYGFIHPVIKYEDRNDDKLMLNESIEYFVHYNNIKMDGFKTLRDGQLVKFSIINTEKGMQAIDVETC
jgi:CspA family cold shock protein